MRDTDIEEISKKYQDDEGFVVSKYIPQINFLKIYNKYGIPKYYIHIMKLNAVPLKRSDTIIALVEKVIHLVS